jgi:hypothetical protein
MYLDSSLVSRITDGVVRYQTSVILALAACAVLALTDLGLNLL